MNVYQATAYRSRTGICCGSCGPEFEAKANVVANTDSEALGMLLEHYPESVKSDWGIEQVKTEIPSVLPC